MYLVLALTFYLLWNSAKPSSPAGTVDPGVIVPLHSHPDRELFCLTEGSIEAFVTDQWHTIGASEVLAETTVHSEIGAVQGGPRDALASSSITAPRQPAAVAVEGANTWRYHGGPKAPF
jgi:hypothetical protein